MRKIITFVTFILLFSPLTTTAIEKGGITMPDQLQSGRVSLTLNGAGIRSKFIFNLYVAGLYLTEKNSDANSIIQSNAAMAIRIHIISPVITSKKFINATLQGFEKSTNNNTRPIAKKIEKFISALSEPIVEGDIFEFFNVSGKGVLMTKNGEEKVMVSSNEFKTALFGIWLSKNPVQAKLRSALLDD